MLSEWFYDTPMDFVSHWLFSACPVGKRCLVVSAKVCQGKSGCWYEMLIILEQATLILPWLGTSRVLVLGYEGIPGYELLRYEGMPG